MDIISNAKKQFAAQNLNMYDILFIIVISIIIIYIIKTFIGNCNDTEKMIQTTSQNNIYDGNSNDMGKMIQSTSQDNVYNGNEIIIEEELNEDYYDKLYHFISISRDKLFPTQLYFCSILQNKKFYLGYVPVTKCTGSSPSENNNVCSNYNIVLEILDDAMLHNNCTFNIFQPLNSKKSYMIGANSIYNPNDYIRLSSSLLNYNSISNVCGDIGVGTHDDWNVYFIQRTIELGNDPPLYNICFIVKNKLYYLTHADETVDPCYYKYYRNGNELTSTLHKLALTPIKILALDFIISTTKPF